MPYWVSEVVNNEEHVMKQLEKIFEVVSYEMKEGREVSDYSGGFVIDGDVIRKDIAEDNDPLYILVKRNNDTVDKYVRSGANDIEPNTLTGTRTARIWHKVL